MATTDKMCKAQRPLAEFAYDLKKRYNITNGQSKRSFMTMYDAGEIQLSSVFENLFVVARNNIGLSTKKVSGDNYDFVKIVRKKKIPLGDMKTTVLRKDGKNRRFCIPAVSKKIGYIYAVGWNWMTNEVNFFALPDKKTVGHPPAGYKIPVCPKTGSRTGGKYNDNNAYDSWDEMIKVG
jgi:hypothetical protein